MVVAAWLKGGISLQPMAVQPTPQVFIAEPSVKSLLIELRVNGNALSTGTGFVAIAPHGPVLVTNRHNVTGRHQQTGQPLAANCGLPNEVAILHNRAGPLGHWVPKVEPLYGPNGAPLWKEHPVLGANADFVALPLTQLTDIELRSYSLGVGDPDIVIAPGEVVSVVGFPFGMTASGCLAIWATGFVATDPDIDYQNLPQFLIDCRSRQGQSGSAVIAYRTGGAITTRQGISLGGGAMTRFLGIYSGRVNPQSDLGFVWKAVALQELVNSIV